MNKNVDYSVYLCTDRELMCAVTVEACVEQALAGGVTVVQLREKACGGAEFYSLGMRIKTLTRAYGVPLIINDRADVAMALGADGVHVGQSDLPCAEVRKIVPKKMLVGVSVSTKKEAVRAQADGADYLGVGAMYPTGTKTDAVSVSMQELAQIRAAVRIPIVVIGGINLRTIPDFFETGVDGLAVVSAIVAKPDACLAAREIKTLWASRKK